MRLNLFILLLVSVLVGQAQRQLEFVNARATENRPYFQYANSLPKIVLEGVMSGQVGALSIDYNSGTISSMSQDEFLLANSERVLEMRPIDPNDPYGKFEEVEALIEFSSGDYTQISLDRDGENIHYVNFFASLASDLPRYIFSVRFNELARYCSEQKALYIVNENPIFYRSGMPHLMGYYLAQMTTGLPENSLWVNDSPLDLMGGYDLGLYLKYSAGTWTLMQEDTNVRMTYEPSHNPTILSLIDALKSKLYSVSDEVPVEQSVASNPSTKSWSFNPKKDKLALTVGYDLDLTRKEFAPLFAKGDELTRHIIDGVLGGELKTYKDPDLTEPLSLDDFAGNLLTIAETGNSDDWGYAQVEERPARPDEINHDALYAPVYKVAGVHLRYDHIVSVSGPEFSVNPKTISLFIPARFEMMGVSRPVCSLDYDAVAAWLKSKAPELLAFISKPTPDMPAKYTGTFRVVK